MSTISNRSLKYVEMADSSLSWRNSQVLKLFLLHHQQQSENDVFELVCGRRTTQN